MKVHLLAPAKINLGLEILKRRDDGYHEVDMVMQSINLFDEVCIEESNEPYIKVFANIDVGCNEQENIAYRSAKKFLSYVDIEDKGINIFINKNIPVCAGLAGGSSDGAAVIVGMNEVLNTKLTQEELLQIGASIGADIPFCILGGTARASGIGTTLNVLKPLKDFYIVLVKPNFSVSTKEAYSMIDKSKIFFNDRVEQLVQEIQMGNNCEMFDKVFNRFEEVNNLDEITNVKNILKNNGANTACMSGSGPSVFGLYSDKDLAIASYKKLTDANMNVFFCEPINFGAHIKSTNTFSI